MATEFIHSAQTVTRVAGADLSTSQYKFVKLDASGNAVPITATTDVPFGLLLNAPKDGSEAHIALTAVGLKAMAGGAIAIGDTLGVASDGRVVKVTVGTDTTKYIVGRAEKEAAGAANIIIQIVVNTLTPRLAA
jgi:hypothetical protein